MDRVEATGWLSENYYNKDWGERFNRDYRMTTVAWGASVDPCLAYLPLIPVYPRAA